MLQRSARQRSACRSRSPFPLAIVTCGVVAAACLAGVEARAAEPARLEWVRLEGAGSCIDRTELESRVKRRLGNEPFDPRASRSIEGVVQRSGKIWRAQIVVRARPDEPAPPRRELESAAADCESLSDAVVLAVALAIDPQAAWSDPTVKAAPPPPPSPLAEAPKPLPVPAATPGGEEALGGRAQLVFAGQLGLLPRASLGLGLGVAMLAASRFELGLRALAFPEVEVSGAPSYAVGLVALTFDFCGVARPAEPIQLRACAGPSLGVLHASVLAGDRTQPGQRASLAGEVGGDAVFALSSKWAVELSARAAVPVTRYRFMLEGSDQPLFAQSAVAGIAHLGLELRLGVARP